jgi:hypothetical protein
MNSYLDFFYRHPLSSLAVFITLLPLGLALQRKASIDQPIRVLVAYLIIKLVIDLAMLHYVVLSRNNLIFYNLSIPIRYVLLSTVLFYYFQSKLLRTFLLASIPLFVLFSVWDMLSTNPDLSDTYNHQLVRYAATVESILMIVWLLAFFYQVTQPARKTDLPALPSFWISSGLLVYFSTYIFIAPLLHYVAQRESTVDLGVLYTAPYFFEIISMVLISLGIKRLPVRNL